MTTKNINSIYPTLTPKERVALTLGARARGDVDELHRLMRTAPLEFVKRAHHRAIALNLERAAFCYIASQLLQLAIIAETEPTTGDHGLVAKGNHLSPRAISFAANRKGWGDFCDAEGLAPADIARDMPGYEFVAEKAEFYATALAAFANDNAVHEEVKAGAAEFTLALREFVGHVDF